MYTWRSKRCGPETVQQDRTKEGSWEEEAHHLGFRGQPSPEGYVRDRTLRLD